MKTTILSGVLMNEHASISFVEVCQKCNISEVMLLEMMEHGLLGQQCMQTKQRSFDEGMLHRIQVACRLQEDLEVNLPGAVLALELMDELAQMREELSMLQHHLKR